MVMRLAFTLIVIAVAVQRLFEVRVSRRHEHALRMRGAVESAAWQMPFMVVLHTAWLVSMVVEVWVLAPAFHPWMAAVASVVFAAGQTLRLLAMRALGSRWTVRILTVPSADPVTRGIYRHVRHPNYLGVVLEIAALPLIGGAVWTAAVFSLANAVMLIARIRAEEAALVHDNAYGEHFGAHARFVPTSRRPRLPS